MEENGTGPLAETAQSTGKESDGILDQIHRELANLSMPCACKSELDRTIRAIEAWHRLKTSAELTREIEADFHRLTTGLSFLKDLERIADTPLTAQELRDHAESLLFLSSRASRCSSHLTALAKVSGKKP